MANQIDVEKTQDQVKDLLDCEDDLTSKEWDFINEMAEERDAYSEDQANEIDALWLKIIG